MVSAPYQRGGILNGVQGTRAPSPLVFRTLRILHSVGYVGRETRLHRSKSPRSIARPHLRGSSALILGVNPNITTQNVTNWTLNVQHAFTSNLSLEVAYVGNHGSNLMGIRDINQPAIGSGYRQVRVRTRQPSRPPGPSRLTDSSRIWPTSTRWTMFTNQVTTACSITMTVREYHHFTFRCRLHLTRILSVTMSAPTAGFRRRIGSPASMPRIRNVSMLAAISTFAIVSRSRRLYSIPGKLNCPAFAEAGKLIALLACIVRGCHGAPRIRAERHQRHR